jgi:hypothetical protein
VIFYFHFDNSVPLFLKRDMGCSPHIRIVQQAKAPPQFFLKNLCVNWMVLFLSREFATTFRSLLRAGNSLPRKEEARFGLLPLNQSFHSPRPFAGLFRQKF